MPQPRYVFVATDSGKFVVCDLKRNMAPVFNGTFWREDQAIRNATQLNREYERWLRESAEIRDAAPGAVL